MMSGLDAPKDEKAQEMVSEHLLCEPFATLRTIAADLKLPRSTIHHILTQDLGMHKFLARWVPHELTDGQKQARGHFFGLCLTS